MSPLIGLWVVALSLGGCAGLSRDAGPAPAPPLAVVESAPPTPEETARTDLMYQLLVGEIAGHMGQLQASLEHYLRAARLSDDPSVAERATRIGLFAEDPGAALPAAERWVALDPESLDARQVLAGLLVNAGRSEEAVPHLLQVLERMESMEGNGLGLLVNVLSRAGDADAAVAAMEQVVRRREDDPRAHLALAHLALGQERLRVAARAAARALELDPHLQEARLLRARALQSAGDTKAALETLEEAVRQDPSDPDLRTQYGRALVQAGRFDQAREQFEAVLKARPGDADTLYTLGLIHIELQHLDRARAYLEQVAETGERSAEAHYYLGRIAEQQGDEEAAVAHYRRVGEGRRAAESLIRIARLRAEQGDVEEARQALQLLRRQAEDPRMQVQAYLGEADILQDAGRPGVAMTVLDAALEAHPEEPDLLYSRALLAERLDRIDRAVADLERILAQDPDNASALNALGYTLADRTDRYEEALEYIRRALEQRPEDPAILDSMGWVLYRLGRLQEAEDYLRRAYERLQDAEVAGHLAVVLWERDRRDEAREILRRALERDPDDEALRRLQQRWMP
ncbi:tetratricopeptide repeat protein [Ectothiorhodospira mobilis]|uniref:tetratricopeptide repeat protein n=1 Tax=Ectothiorhodospira mobilis TaxID=195064 RepID=UPI001907B2F9|nr:tetratricopeptide repeat protein [Ectothiorhodospira mobilis]